MELYEKLLAEEIFVEQLRICGMLRPEDLGGKECLIVCGMGGIGLLRCRLFKGTPCANGGTEMR